MSDWACVKGVQWGNVYNMKIMSRNSSPLSLASGVTLLFEHSPSRTSEIEHFEIFSRLRENQLAQQLFVKFNLL